MTYSCRICGTALDPFMSFGEMPIANGFISEKDFKNEYYFEMEVAFCENCYMFQLINQPQPEQMFNENYAYLASTSKEMQSHWSQLAKTIFKEFNCNKKSFIVEIGSNDGIFLQNIAKFARILLNLC